MAFNVATGLIGRGALWLSFGRKTSNRCWSSYISINAREIAYECQVQGRVRGLCCTFRQVLDRFVTQCLWLKPSYLYQFSYHNILREGRTLYSPVPGGNYQNPELNGISHFLPHWLIKGVDLTVHPRGSELCSGLQKRFTFFMDIIGLMWYLWQIFQPPVTLPGLLLMLLWCLW